MIVSSNGGSSSYYTWAQAQSEGAGSEGGSEGGEGAPSITSVSPKSGPVTGGTSVTISGTELRGVKSVHFGSTPATSFTITSSSSISAVAPPGSAGLVDVMVTSAAGTSATVAHDRFKFEPVVTSIGPTSGSKNGGTRVTIFGAGFAIGSLETTVTFGSADATQVSCPSSGECTALAPAHAAGRVAVKVKVNRATSGSNPAAKYTFS
jgi:hypothetical protein